MRPQGSRAGVAALLLAGAAVLLFTVSLSVGPAQLSPAATFAGLLDPADPVAGLIVWEIRLPRTLLAFLIGAVLGLSGAALQGLLRNPLAEPGLLGVSPAAAFGAVAVFYSGLAGSFALALPLGGIAGAGLAVLLLQLLAGRGGVLTLILAGVAVSSFAGALTSLALNLSPNPFATAEIVFWLLGSVADRSWQQVALALPFLALGSGLLLSATRGLEALSLGEEAAATLGQPPQRTRGLVVFGTALAVGAATAVSGAIGFVGLIVPHVLRPLVGHRPGRLLPLAALGGGTLLLAADLCVRLLSPGPELKLGVVTALVGAPFFLLLLLRLRREVA
nr:iron ABC transporter permease [Algihabitans albus]